MPVLLPWPALQEGRLLHGDSFATLHVRAGRARVEGVSLEPKTGTVLWNCVYIPLGMRRVHGPRTILALARDAVNFAVLVFLHTLRLQHGAYACV